MRQPNSTGAARRSWVKVTNLANGKGVVVRVNDRRPFPGPSDRPVRRRRASASGPPAPPRQVRAVGPRFAARRRHKPDARASASRAARLRSPCTRPATGHAHLYVQVGAYGEPANAQRAAETPCVAPGWAVQVEDANVNSRRVRRVRLGPLSSADETDRVVDTVRRLGLGPPAGHGRLNACRFSTAQPPQSGAPRRTQKPFLPPLLSASCWSAAANQARRPADPCRQTAASPRPGRRSPPRAGERSERTTAAAQRPRRQAGRRTDGRTAGGRRQAWVLLDYATGQVLADEHVDDPLEPASITKGR